MSTQTMPEIRQVAASAPSYEPKKQRLGIIRRHKKLSGLLAFLLIAGTSALAAWLIFSDGEGGGRVGSLVAPTVSAGTPVGYVLPGGTGPLAFQVSNPNSASLRVTSVAAPATPAGSTSSPQCPLSNFSLQEKTLTTPISVPPGTSTVEVPDVVMMATDSPAECQNQTFSIRARLNFTTG